MTQKTEMNRRKRTAGSRVLKRYLRMKLKKLTILKCMSRKVTCYEQMAEKEARRMRQLRYRKKEQPVRALPPVLK